MALHGVTSAYYPKPQIMSFTQILVIVFLSFCLLQVHSLPVSPSTSSSSTSSAFLPANYTVQESHVLKWLFGFYSTNLHNLQRSPEFTSLNGSSNRFQLIFNKIGNAKNYGEIALQYVSRNKPELYIRYRLSIMDRYGGQHHKREFQWHYLESNSTNGREELHSYIQFDEIKSLWKRITGDLFLYCELDVLNYPQTESKLLSNQIDSLKVMAKHYADLRENGTLADFTFVVGGTEFPVHKAILSARSPVFVRMFAHELTEDRLELPDADAKEVEVFEQLLRYIYSGVVPDLNKYALDLLVPSKEYQLDHLNSLCQQWLASSLTVESAASMLLLADGQHEHELKASCINFITDNVAAFIETDGFSLIKKRFDLVDELFLALSNKAMKAFKSKK